MRIFVGKDGYCPYKPISNEGQNHPIDRWTQIEVIGGYGQERLILLECLFFGDEIYEFPYELK